MIDIPPPAHIPHTWRDFFIHIATIVVGLVIAIGLEQTVEVIHNRHARRQLLEDVHEELESNQIKDRMTQQSLASIRVYLVGLNDVLTKRRAGNAASVDPALENRRAMSPLYGSSMAAWQSAKESGLAALLPSGQIRLYDRFEVQLAYRRDAITSLDQAQGAIQAFEERFRDSPAVMMFGAPSTTPDLSTMSSADLTEYSSLVATAIQNIDRLAGRTALMDDEDSALLHGTRTEDDLVKASYRDLTARPSTPTIPSSTK